MTIAFRSSANVVNGTAGTSVTVARPAGAPGDDVFVAFVAQAGTASVTPPAGWILIGSQSASTTVTVAAYWRTAAGVAGSSTFTLGASARNWGWIGAYSGVDLVTPIAANPGADAYTSSGTEFSGPSVHQPESGWVLAAVGAVRTAGGSATTWTESNGTERFDGSTNAGSGTDITGAVSDADLGNYDIFTASQSQSQTVAWTVMLNPRFTAYDPALPLETVVEAAFGADPDGDPSGWVWADITDRVRGGEVVITKGRSDWSGQANPTEIRLALLNADDRFTPENPFSDHWPHITRNLPLRVSVPVGYEPPTERATAFVRSWQTTWDGAATNPVVSVVARGRLARMQRQRTRLRSSMYRSISAIARTSARIAPVAYWPCEDAAGAGSAASAIPGVAPMAVRGTTFAADSTLTGSMPLPTIADGAGMLGTIPGYTATGQWFAVFPMKVPTAPSVVIVPVAVLTTGTAYEWAIVITPASPDTVGLHAYDGSGTQILADDISVTEATFYGQWFLYSIGVRQNGSNVDYTLWVQNQASGYGVSGTLNARTHGNAVAMRSSAIAANAGSAMGHFAVHTDPAVDFDLDSFWLTRALDGFVGEEPSARFQRLCDEEGIPNSLDTQVIAGQLETVIGMGPQPVGTLTDALQQCSEVDGGFIHDGGASGALVFNTRHSRVNTSASLTANNHLEQVDGDLTTVLDDQQIVNDMTVAREGGSSAHYVNSASQTTEGSFPDDATLNLDSDVHLSEIAGWRTNVGTATGTRYPQLPINLVASPELVKQWLACRIGSRVAGTNLPGRYVDADAFVEGYTERLSADTWNVTPNCSPARPYDVFVLDGTGNTGRLDTAGSTLTANYTIGATSLSVATSSGPLWLTGAVAFDAEIAGIRVSVSNVSGSTSPQTFTVSGVTKALPNNGSVKLWRPSVLAL